MPGKTRLHHVTAAMDAAAARAALAARVGHDAAALAAAANVAPQPSSEPTDTAAND